MKNQFEATLREITLIGTIFRETLTMKVPQQIFHEETRFFHVICNNSSAMSPARYFSPPEHLENGWKRARVFLRRQ